MLLGGTCCCICRRGLESGIGIVHCEQEGTRGNGRGGNGIYLTTVLRYGKRIGWRLSDNVALLALLEPLVGLGTRPGVSACSKRV